MVLFDTIDIDELLCIIVLRFKISGVAFDWYRSYLTDMSPYVPIGSPALNTITIYHDVPSFLRGNKNIMNNVI